jgi:hypothetical protein
MKQAGVKAAVLNIATTPGPRGDRCTVPGHDLNRSLPQQPASRRSRVLEFRGSVLNEVREGLTDKQPV